MPLEYSNYINEDAHNRTIKLAAYKIKSGYTQGYEYLNDLSVLILEDIKNVSMQIHNGILYDKKINNSSFTLEEFKNCIQCGTETTLPLYESLIGSYNMGGMMSCENFNELKTSIMKEASELCNKQSELLTHQYKDSLDKETRENKTYYVIVFTLIFSVIAAFPVLTSLYNQIKIVEVYQLACNFIQHQEQNIISGYRSLSNNTEKA